MDGKMSLITLWDYQEKALFAVIQALQAGIHRQLIVLPTASGKTFVMAAIAKLLNLKVLLIAHRDELLQQAANKFRTYWPKADIGICKAEKKEFDHQIVIGSTQTCCRPSCLRQLKEKNFDILMIDETHHAPANTYQRIIKELGFAAGTEKLLVGVTATPMRADKKELGDFFDKIVYSKTAGELIEAGYLSPIIGRRLLTSFNLNGVHTRMGDFAVNELASAVNTEARNKFVVDKFKEHTASRKAIAFCVDVKHCRDLAKAFNAQGIKAKAVWGDMGEAKRKKTLSNFSKDRFQVVTSCGILTEGFDEPSIQAIVMTRPTKSNGFYIQMVGRGLRKHPGKEDCLVLDFADQYHNLNTVISLSKAIPEAKTIEEENPKVEREKIVREPRIKTLRDVDHEFDILGRRPRFLWTDIGDGDLSLADDGNNEIVIQPSDGGFVASVFYKYWGAKSITSKPESVDRCIAICERFARKHLSITYADLRNPWLEAAQHQPATPAQTKLLEEYGAFKQGMSKAEACFEIRKILALQHKEQRRCLNPTATRQKITQGRSLVEIRDISKGRSLPIPTSI